MEKITVLIPTWNRALYIKDCLNSILRQTYENLEIVIYDDGSTDNTVKIINSIADKRIKLYKNLKNKGIVAARNNLLNLAKTRLACWQDSDDLSNINRIQTQYDYIKGKQIILSTGHQYFKSGKPKLNHLNKLNEDDKRGCFASIMFYKNTAVEFSKNRPIAGEDTKWIKDMIVNGIPKENLDYMLHYIRKHGQRISVLKEKIRKRKIPTKDANGNIIPFAEIIKKYEHFK